MDWTYQDCKIQTPPDNCVGFVYLITNLVTGRKYVGKKLFWFSKTSYKTVALKNGTKKKKKVHTQIESDWKEYHGSSVDLCNDVSALGTNNFSRQILHLCYGKGDLSYMELREQMDRRVLETSDYYNGIIQVKIHKKHVKTRT